MVELAKFRNPQCAKITSREIFETANREIYQLAKKTRFTVFVRPKYMFTYFRAPKAREQRSSDCTRLATKPLAAHVPSALVRGCLCIC